MKKSDQKKLRKIAGMVEDAKSQLEVLNAVCEGIQSASQAYIDARSEAWHDTDVGIAFVNRFEELESATAALTDMISSADDVVNALYSSAPDE